MVRSLAFSADGGDWSWPPPTGLSCGTWSGECPSSHLDKQPLPFLPRHLTRIEVGGGAWPADVGPMVLNKDRTRAAFWGRDRKLHIYGSATLKAHAEIPAAETPISIAFHPTEDLIAHSRANAIYLHRASDGTEIATLRPEIAAHVVTTLDFSPDGKWVVSGLASGDVRLWEVAHAQGGAPLGR